MSGNEYEIWFRVSLVSPKRHQIFKRVDFKFEYRIPIEHELVYSLGKCRSAGRNIIYPRYILYIIYKE